MRITLPITVLMISLSSSPVIAFQSVSNAGCGAFKLVNQQPKMAVCRLSMSSNNDDGDFGVSDIEGGGAAAVADADVISIDRDKSAEKAMARDEVIELAEQYQSRYGVILFDPKKKQIFRDAVERLERIVAADSGEEESATTSSSISSDDPSLLVGDWTLVCSASYYPNENKIIDNDTLSSFLTNLEDNIGGGGPIQDVRDTLNDSIEVIQKIKCSSDDGNINKVDHIIDYKPPNKLSSFLKNLPDPLSNLDINPLKVKETKVVLQHDAEIKQTIPNIDINLILKSIVVNVAGESEILEPDGADVLGINIPFGEFLQAGSFETTVLDSSMRVSRSKLGGVSEQIRVFRKTIDDNDGSVYEKSSVVVSDDGDDDTDYDDDELADDNDDGDDTIVDVVDEGGDRKKSEEDDIDDSPSDVN